jgi:hypothetical protein
MWYDFSVQSTEEDAMFEDHGTMEGFDGTHATEKTGIGDDRFVLLKVPNDATYIPWM